MLVSQMLSLSEELSEMKMTEKCAARVMFRFHNLVCARYIHAIVSPCYLKCYLAIYLRTII